MKQAQIADLARQIRDCPLKTLNHHIDLDWLYEAWRRVRKSGAAGIDGCTAENYAEHLEENLRALLSKFKTGIYRAPPTRSVYIPKAGSEEKRRLCLPTIEDKILQRAVLMVLEPIYEQDFYDTSYGFRKGKSAHQAIRHIHKTLQEYQGGTVIELDIKKCFDSIPHKELQELLRVRISDKKILRAIGKWLNAGVVEDYLTTRSDFGCPQGGVISPTLMNVYIHNLLDGWFYKIVLLRLKGRAELVRFADDAVLIFEKAEDAERVLRVLPKRFEKFGLTLHPEKTRLIRFDKPNRSSRGPKDQTLDFLGFTLYWGRTRKGLWTPKLKTAKSRLYRTLKAINQWCRKFRHMPLEWQHEKLCAKLNGYYRYFGMTYNLASLSTISYQVRRIWQKWLNRRSQRKGMNYDRFSAYLKAFPLPAPKIYHSIFSPSRRTLRLMSRMP